MASQLRKGLRHLLTRNGIIKRRNGNIATVNNLSPVAVGIDIRTGVESSKGGLARRGMANCSRTKSSAYKPKSAIAHTSCHVMKLTWSIAHSSIKRSTYDGDVESLRRVQQTLGILKMSERSNARE